MRALSIALLAAPLTFLSVTAEEMMDTFKRICAEKEQAAGAVKCRRHFTSQGYSAQWTGDDTSLTHHGTSVEVLTRGDDAVVCWSTVLPVTDWSLCLALERKR